MSEAVSGTDLAARNPHVASLMRDFKLLRLNQSGQLTLYRWRERLQVETKASCMAVYFNHTILKAQDSKASATFLAEILGLPAPKHWGPFQMVTTRNDTNLDYMDTDGEISPQHYAFLVSEAEFDAIFGRVRDRKLTYWADPAQKQEGEINHHDGGRGVYFEDPNGHLLEIITRPYGSGGWNP
jgi:catechol 2,3-dioxygenase-like lactoylglutathione lyase family enzyme